MQTPAPVDYARAGTIDEAVRLLQEKGEDARLIAGGHSLIPRMRLRLAQPEWVSDINGLSDLDYIRVDGDELVSGALTRHATCSTSPASAGTRRSSPTSRR
jgi:carbon-monoxide dehydrogenase medium subunit